MSLSTQSYVAQSECQAARNAYSAEQHGLNVTSAVVTGHQPRDSAAATVAEWGSGEIPPVVVATNVIEPAVLSFSGRHADGWVTIISVVCSPDGE